MLLAPAVAAVDSIRRSVGACNGHVARDASCDGFSYDEGPVDTVAAVLVASVGGKCGVVCANSQMFWSRVLFGSIGIIGVCWRPPENS